MRAMIAWLRERGYNVEGFDGDTRNGHLSRFQGSKTIVERGALRDSVGWSAFYKYCQNVPDDHLILVDLPGNVGDMVEAETERLRMFADAVDRDILNVWVASEEEDSIWLLKSALAVADASRTLFWMNGRFAPNIESFELWSSSKTRVDFIADGGLEAFLPVLPIYARTKIIKARCAFDEVSNAHLDPIENIDFQIWWNEVDQQLAGFSRLLESLA